MGGDQQIVCPKYSTTLRERLPNLSLVNARSHIERQDIQIEAERLEFLQVGFDANRVGGAEAKLGVRDRGDAYGPCIRFELLPQRLSRSLMR